MSDAKEFFISGLDNYLRGDYELAKKLFEKSLEFSPDKLSTLTNYSATLIELGLLEDAINVCNQILYLDDQNIEGMLNKSNIYKIQKKYKESIFILNKVIGIDKNNKEAYNNIGIIYHILEEYDLAIKYYETALSISNEFIEPRLNMASSLLQIDRIIEAINLLEIIIESDNQSYEAYCNLGIAYTKLNVISTSLDYFDKALKLNPKYHKAIWNKSISLLLSCNYITGFKLYESRFFIDEFTKSELINDTLNIKLLENKLQIKNKKIYVINEQGYGDTIQFCRYIFQMVDLGGVVTLKVQNPLLRLIKNSIKVATIVGDDFIPSEFDYYCPLLSLPYIFETSINNIEYRNKYLNYSSDIGISKSFLNLRLNLNKKIGIVWRGNRHHKNDRNRSISLLTLIQHLSKAYSYISLQVDTNQEEIDILNKNNIKYYTNIEDFNDTAYLCENLDGVISVDTSVAHLSCALGIKTLILLPCSPDWRWGLNGDRTGWYNSAILLRQSKPNNWESALNNLSKAIQHII